MNDQMIKHDWYARIEHILCEAMSAAIAINGSAGDEAIKALVVHIQNNWTALRFIHEGAQASGREIAVANPAVALIRCMYDALLQALYIAHDSERRDALGEDYLDYAYIREYKDMQLIINGSDSLSKRLANSPLRIAREPEIRANYAKHKSRYLAGEKGVRDKWYEARNLWEIASLVGKSSEYGWYCTLSNGSIHADSRVVQHGPRLYFSGELYPIAANVACQAIKLLTKELDIQLSKENADLLNLLAKDFCNFYE
ncbi:MAG TPA: DUF5677 domain-containing protein [Phycisphaerae bacterium]|nr:DUF5677 domain-containing protein [Phycisphaerae bacterium]